MNRLLEELTWRGLLKDHTDIDTLSAQLDQGPITLYCGYDPTADSLHLGNLQMVVMLRHFQLAGHRIVALSGGGTGLIGDPSGRTDERQLRTEAVVQQYTQLITQQLSACLSDEGNLLPPIFVDNQAWLGQISAIDFLRDVGKHFTINYMLAKDSVSSRIGNDSAGLSFTEFSYMLLQAFDYLSLNRLHDCTLQIGGSDQWGNITAGISLIKRTIGKTVYGLTSPLILRSDGKKFGKSESGAIWLSRHKTSPFALYQHLMNTPDSDAIMLLKRLTTLSKEEILTIETQSLSAPEQRIAQKRLADNITTFLHGAAALEEAVHVTDWLFGKGATPRGKNISELLAGAPSVEVTIGQYPTWVELLAAENIVSSKSEGRRLVQAGGLYIWDRRVESIDTPIEHAVDFIDDLVVLSKGKKSKTVIRLIKDA